MKLPKPNCFEKTEVRWGKYFKIMVKEGWVNKETGKKSEPRIQFIELKQLQDVLPQFAKKLRIEMDIKELQTNLVSGLNELFKSNKGDKQVTFEIIKKEKIVKVHNPVPKNTIQEEDTENESFEEMQIDIPTLEEEKIVTRVVLPSRKLKVGISSELLNQLDKMNVKFKLN